MICISQSRWLTLLELLKVSVTESVEEAMGMRAEDFFIYTRRVKRCKAWSAVAWASIVPNFRHSTSCSYYPLYIKVKGVEFPCKTARRDLSRTLLCCILYIPSLSHNYLASEC